MRATKTLLGITSEDNPSQIDIYAKDFESKEKLEDFIKQYNDEAKNDGREDDVINYTDIVGIMMSSVSTIITAISSVLIAFVAILFSCFINYDWYYHLYFCFGKNQRNWCAAKYWRF